MEFDHPREVIDYTQINLQKALLEINSSQFDANMDGTDIFEPLKHAFGLKSE